MNGGPSVWAISPEERVKHDQKFDTLSPSMGYVSGEQARKFFLQSGLPASVLAEIWALADMNKDGKMDRLEFSIAMKLIKLKLQGTPLPSALPIIMKQPPVPAPSLNNPTSSMTNPAYGIGSMSSMPMMPGTNFAMLTPISMATPGLSTLSPMTGLTPLVPTATGLNPLIASTSTRPLMPTMGNATLPNGTMGIFQPFPAGALNTGLPLSGTSYPSSLGLSSSAGINRASSLLDLGSGSSASSSPSVMSPMAAVPSDWAVPHASRLKYRQQFNSLDKQMIGYLTGQQVRGAMATTMLTQTQLASIWTLADVDKDGKLKAEEFILAMHLVDMARSGQPLPLTLPTELLPPSQRGAMNGSSSSLYAALTDDFDIEPPQKAKTNMSFEDKFKANLERGNAELEKRRVTLLEAERREQERRAQKEREGRERREREAREAEERRRKEEERRRNEEERRLERQRELERQKEEERQREMERKEREMERQRKEELERRRRGELQIKKEQEQDDIITLKAKKRSLEMELEAVGNKHRQISDRLRGIQNKKKLQKTELDLNNQRKETRQQDISILQKQLEEFQRKLSQLTPEQKRLTEKLNNMGLNNLPVSTMSTLTVGVTEKKGACLKLRDQLQALEKETAAKLAKMDQYNKDMQELSESQRKQQAALEKLRSVKEDKSRELIRRKAQEEERRRNEEEQKRQEEERRRKEEEEAQRRIKMEKERQWQEKLKRDEEARQRRLQEEKEAKQKEEEEKERQALIQAVKEQAEQELRAKEEERKRREEEERKKREEEERKRQAERRRQDEERRKLEEERRQLEEERRKLEEERRQEERRRKEEEERRRREEEMKRLEEERREKEFRREREEEERRREKAAEAAVRDTEERRKRDEEERKRKEEEDRRKRDDERKRLHQQQEEEKRRREEERKRVEEERKRVEEERKRKEEGEERRKAEERKRKEEAPRQQQQPNGGKVDIQEKLTALLRGLEERKGGQPRATQHRKSAALTSFKALYPFTARNNEELSFGSDDIIEVDETVEREEGWLYGSRQGKMGWFPESYVERDAPSHAANNTASAAPPPPPKVPLQSQLSKALEAAKVAGTKSAFTPTHSPNPAPSETQGQQVLGNLLAQALCSWTAKTDNHLNFNKDDVIQVLEQQENWWLGELNGERGWFPKTYVTLLGEEEASDMKSSPPDVSDSSDSLQLEEYVALYTYESPEPGDLTFKEGDVILVSKREGEWWNGSIGDRTGVFPSNYIKPKETDTSSISVKKKPEIAQVMRAHSSTGPEQLNLENGQLILILGKNVSGWWLGELQARGKKRQKGWFPATHVKVLGSTSGKSTPAPQPVCQVIAIYDYAAANKDEMSFTKGQLINVLDKNNPDWWKGEMSGVTGLFPTNYVKMTTADCDPSQQWW